MRGLLVSGVSLLIIVWTVILPGQSRAQNESQEVFREREAVALVTEQSELEQGENTLTPLRSSALTQIVVEEPALMPAYGSTCSTGWHGFTNNRGHQAYLTLNTNDPGQSTNSGRWTPNLPQAGRWRVEAFIANHGPMIWPCTGQYISWDTSDARYTIHSSSGVRTVSANQSPLFDGWLDLGVYDFAAGSNGYVELKDLNGEANLSHFVSFSAMRFTWEGASEESYSVTVGEPVLTPSYGAICSTGWYGFTTQLGLNAYLTLNTNDPGQSTNSGRWTPNLPRAGNYRVEAYIPDHDPMTWPCTGHYISWDTSDARYQVHHKEGTASVTGNQSPLANQWLDLGVFYFDAGTVGYVELTDLNSESNLSHFVSFSAMRFTLQEDGTAVETLILTNRQRLESLFGASETTRIMNKLNQLAAHASVQGEVIQVENDPSVADAFRAWDEHLSQHAYANNVSSAIYRLISAKVIAHPEVKYIVIVGDDRIIPFRREPNRAFHCENFRCEGRESDYPAVSCSTTIGAALCSNMNLTDNFYGDRRIEPWHEFQPYLPDLAVGRLVENPDEIVSQIDAFLASTARTPTTAASVGTDFMLDTAREIRDRWQGKGLSVDSLINNTWDKSRFLQQVVNTRHELVSLNTHADHCVIGAGNGDKITSHDISASTGDLSQALYFSLGCHSGLNVPPQNPVDSFDLPQVFVRKGATYVGNTGYGWGSTSGVGWSERLMSIYADMVYGRSISVGQALAAAKRSYASSEALPDAYDAKVLLQATLYGLPHYKFLTASRDSTTDAEEIKPYTVVTQSISAVAGGLTRSTTTYSFPDFENIVHDTGAFYTLAGHAQIDNGVPLQPRAGVDISVVKTMAHGAVLRSAVYQDLARFDPVVGQAMTDGSVAVEPDFDAPGWYPSLPFTVNRFDSLATLALVLGQYDSASQTERLYRKMTFDVYYHDSSSDWTPPTVGNVSSMLEEGQLSVTVYAADASGLQAVIATYTNRTGTWESVELEATDSGWTGSFSVGANTRYFVQVVDGAGNVAVADNNGRYFAPQQGLYIMHLPLMISRE